MAFKTGGRVLCQLPFGNSADTTGSGKPFIAKPAGRPAVSGIHDQKHLVAVGCNSCLITENVDGPDTMQHPPAGRPELNFNN